MSAAICKWYRCQPPIESAVTSAFEMAHRFIYDRADLGIGDDDKVFDEMNEVAAEFEAVASKLKAVIEKRAA